jgi:histidinol-phosphate aminotransferase
MEAETHGGLNYIELRSMGIDPASLIDFSTNVNPFGPSPRAIAALRAIDPSPYPDRDALDLRMSLSRANAMPLDNVMAGNGTAELIWLAAHAFLRTGDTVVIIGPTFGEYERAARANGANVIPFCAVPPLFQLDVDDLVACIQKHLPRLVFLCNPNNPTGLYLEDSDVRRIAQTCTGGFLVLDEAYRSFVAPSPFGPLPTSNTLVLRSMTKDFALAGLRLGYALGPPALLDVMRAIQPPWSVSSAAQAAGLASLYDLGHLYRTLELTRQSMLALRAALSALGVYILPGKLHYTLIDVGYAAAWRKQLMASGCLVRDCSSFGLTRYVRVSTRSTEENHRLVQAWSVAARLGA